MATGFGSSGRPGMPQGVEIQVGPQIPPEELTADHLEAIRKRYCQPPTLLPQPFGTLAANQGTVLRLQNQKVNALLVTVTTGLVFGYFGDFTNGFGRPAVNPHFVLSAAVSPVSQVIPLPPGDQYVITLQEGAGATVTGCLTPMAL